MKPLLKIIIWLFMVQIVVAQNSVTIYENIKRPKGNKVYVRYFKDYITYERGIADSALIDNEGNFAMNFLWSISGPADFFHGDERTDMFLSPDDSIKITLDTRHFDETVIYEGIGADINNYLAQKVLLFPSQMASVIYKMQEEEFKRLVDSLHHKELNYFKDFLSVIPTKIYSVNAFKEYEEARINYNWASTKADYPPS